MKTIVLAYEDKYHDGLHALVKARRRYCGLPSIILETWPIAGTGNFVRDVPTVLHWKGRRQTKNYPDRVVCVADADRPRNLVPGYASVTPVSGDTTQWVRGFESTWREHLVKSCALSEEAAGRLRVCCLRQNKESVLVSCPEALLEHGAELHGQARRAELRAFLEACVPAPLTMAAQDFVGSYRKPAECLERVFQLLAGRHYKKGRDDEDLLQKRIVPNPAWRKMVFERCPDLKRLLDALVFDAEPGAGVEAAGASSEVVDGTQPS